MTGFGGGLRWIACMITGGTALGGMTYGGLRVAGGEHSPYRLGQRYCSKTQTNVCLVFGPFAEGDYKGPGVWFEEPSSYPTALGSVAWLENSYLKILFEEYPGLKGFAKEIIEGYEKRKCNYDQRKLEMTCPN